MYQRSAKNKVSLNGLITNENKKKQIQKHLIPTILSILPQLAISFAILVFAFANSNTSFNDHCSGVLFYISLVSGICVAGVFITLQIEGVEYKNWQQDPKTRQYIQIASLSSIISFFGFNFSLWHIYGLATPILIMAAFTFSLSILIIVATRIT